MIGNEILDNAIDSIRKANEENRLSIDCSANTVEVGAENGYRTFKTVEKTITFTIKVNE